MDTKKAIIIFAGVFVLAGIVIALMYFGPFANKMVKGKAEAAIAENLIEVKDKSQIADYFIELPQEEVKQLLADAKNKGEVKFLMPQFDLSITESFTVKNESIESEDKTVEYLTVSGLPSGTEIRASIDGLISGGIAQRNEPYVWVRQFEGGSDDNDRDNTLTVMYFPAFIIPGNDFKPFSEDISAENYGPILMGTKISKILSESPLDASVVPGAVSLAVAIDKEGDFEAAKMENLLLKNGRIVMIKQ